MDQDDATFLYGTSEAPPGLRALKAGPLRVLVQSGGLRGVFFEGVEVLRGLDYPIRDENWGTLPTETLDEDFTEREGAFSYVRRFRVNPGLSGRLVCEGRADGVLTCQLTLTADSDVRVNRAGFVLLHPTDCAGKAMQILHSDGVLEESVFPQLISPSQPASDIGEIRLRLQGVDVSVAFSGDTFEMEDQRNWSDASFKTYCRPLSLPYPFEVSGGSEISQSVRVSLSRVGRAETVARSDGMVLAPSAAKVPAVALALEPGWQDFPDTARIPAVGSTQVRIDLCADGWEVDLRGVLPHAVGGVSLELVVPNELEAVAAVLRDCADVLEALGCVPRSVFALPVDYLKSYQPDARWPAGTTPEDVVTKVREVFPGCEAGCGMLTNFTELNRYRSAAVAGDFMTHSTTAIVHASEDEAVMQTLEALPHIYRSARELAPDIAYRLGLASIGMRSNPYGADVVANPEGMRIPMARHDPRQKGLFAAAFMVGVMAATQGSTVDEIALAAPSGPFGLSDGQRLFPVYPVFEWLCAAAGQSRVDVSLPSGLVAVGYSNGGLTDVLVANVTSEPIGFGLSAVARFRTFEYSADLEDGRVTTAWRSGDRVELDAWGIGFVRIGESD